MGWLSDHINLIGLIAAIVIIILTTYVSYFYINKMKTEAPKGELTSHEWDGIKEFYNDVPKGWLILLMATIVWAIWYIFFGYPLNSYSQIGEYNEEIKANNTRFHKQHENISIEGLEKMGGQLFLLQCSQCHGITAEGINGKAQNLTHWGKEQGIIDAVLNGSKGLKQPNGEDYMAGEMPAGLLDDKDELKAVAGFIMSNLVKDGKTRDKDLLEKGGNIFATACAACHGDDGAGMDGMAVNLVEYGKAPMVQAVLQHGKLGDIGHMPSFKYLNFDEIHIKALSAFIASQEPVE